MMVRDMDISSVRLRMPQIPTHNVGVLCTAGTEHCSTDSTRKEVNLLGWLMIGKMRSHVNTAGV